MAIQEIDVKRDSYGFWTHPNFPDFGERIANADLAKWESDNNITVKQVAMDGDESASEALLKRWFEDGSCDCSEWNPTAPTDNSFLLSIYETEDGPLALWAVPTNDKLEN